MINGKPLTVGGAKGLEPTIFVNSITGSTISCDGIVGQEKSKPNPAYRDLPSGYTQLESIVGTGSQTIDLGVSADANTTIELCIVPNTSYTSEYAIFGTLWSASASFLMEYNGKFRFHNGGNYGDLATVTSEETTIKTDSTGVTINGTNYPLSAGTSYSSNNLMLYGVTGTSDKKGHFVTKYLKRWQGTTLTLDLVPCKRNSDNVVSLYDMVNDTFLTPTGTFIGGAEVPASFPYWEFKTSIGTHTIVGQYDGKTQSKTVVVDAVGVYEVEIDYKLWLYKLGDECDDVTGGWIGAKLPKASSSYSTSSSAPTIVREATYIQATQTTNYFGDLTTTNTIDLTNYTKAGFHIKYAYVGSEQFEFIIGASDINYYNQANLDQNIIAYGSSATITEQDYEYDIASITGSKKLFFSFSRWSTNSVIQVSKVWLA